MRMKEKCKLKTTNFIVYSYALIVIANFTIFRKLQLV